MSPSNHNLIQYSGLILEYYLNSGDYEKEEECSYTTTIGNKDRNPPATDKSKRM